MAPPLRQPSRHATLASPSMATLLAMVAASALLGAACDPEAKSVTAKPEPATTADSASAAESATASTGDSTATDTVAPDDSTPAPEGADTATAKGPGSKQTGSSDAKPVVGKEENTDAYGTWLQSSGRYVAGKPATVQAVLVAKGGFKCNDKYPYKFKLGAPSAGVTYPQTTVRGIQYGKQRSTLTIPFTPSQAGKATISGTFYVSVCDPSKCKIGKQKLSVTVTVEPS